MLNFLKRKVSAEKPPDEIKKPTFLTRLKAGLHSTRRQLIHGLTDLTLGKTTIDADLLDEIEALLLNSDVGVSTTEAIISDLHRQLGRAQGANGRVVWEVLRQHLITLLQVCEQP